MKIYNPDGSLKENWSRPTLDSSGNISVIIPFSGEVFEKQLRMCVKNLQLTNSINAEIIVVEHSPSPTVDDIDCRYIHIEQKEDELFNKSKCFNVGVHEAKHDIVTGLDCDCLTPPDFLAIGVASMNMTDAHAAFIADDIFYTDNFDGSKCYLNGKSWRKDRINRQFQGASWFMKKYTYEAIGGHFEMFEGYSSEDTEFFYRVLYSFPTYVAFGAGEKLIHMNHDKGHYDQEVIKRNRDVFASCQMIPLHDLIGHVRRSNTALEKKEFFWATDDCYIEFIDLEYIKDLSFNIIPNSGDRIELYVNDQSRDIIKVVDSFLKGYEGLYPARWYEVGNHINPKIRRTARGRKPRRRDRK